MYLALNTSLIVCHVRPTSPLSRAGAGAGARASGFLGPGSLRPTSFWNSARERTRRQWSVLTHPEMEPESSFSQPSLLLTNQRAKELFRGYQIFRSSFVRLSRS